VSISLSFLGAAGSVTGSQYLLTAGDRRILVDCGLFQGSSEEIGRNRMSFSYPAEALDAVLLTHAHLDHCGRLPALVRAGFRGPVVGTAGTTDLAAIVWADAAHLQQEASERWARRHPDDHHPEPMPAEAVPAEAALLAADKASHRLHGPAGPRMDTMSRAPLYTSEDVARTIDQARPLTYDLETEIAPGVVATFRDAGHILGSAIIELAVRDHDGVTTRVVFSGDLGRPSTPILRDPYTIRSADVVVCESTYGDREHPPTSEAVDALAEVVGEVAGGQGVLLIPAFAIGRTQEIVWILDDLVRTKRVPHLPLYLDSPMASKASDIYLRHPETYDAETMALLSSGDSPLEYPGQIETPTVDASKGIVSSPRPHIIIASSGMLTGGRVLHHLKDVLPDPASTLLFIGYQGEGTLGRHLQSGGKTARIDGAEWPVACRVRTIPGFSAHADEAELLDWIGHFATAPEGNGRPRSLFLTHGEPAAAQALAGEAQARFGLTAQLPTYGQTVTLRP
jgi:metallo-beta-lactamase family protein